MTNDIPSCQPSSVSPDVNAAGFLTEELNALRYDGQSDDPDEVASSLASFIPKGARILDVGCGTGSVTKIILASSSGQVVGIEPDPVRARVALARGIDVRNSFLTDELVRALGQFDVVMFADVLEHLPNPSTMLDLARGALTPGGCIVASVPNIAHWSVRANLMRGRFDYESCGIMDATHLRWFTKHTIVALFKSVGMRVERHRVTAGFTLPIYNRAFPWRGMHSWHRQKLIRFCLRHAPLLFGCQHVVKAVSAGKAGS